MEALATRVGPGLPALIKLSIPSSYISGAELLRQLHRASDGIQHYRLKLGSHYVPDTEETIYRPQAFQEALTFEPVTLEELRGHIHLDRAHISAAYVKSVYDQLLAQGYPEILLQQALADSYQEIVDLPMTVMVKTSHGHQITTLPANATLGDLRSRFADQRLVRDGAGSIIVNLPDSTPLSQIETQKGVVVGTGMPTGSSSSSTGESYRRQALQAAIRRARDRETAALRELDAATGDLQKLLEEARQLGMESL